ncbi:helix-turn-helix domain-containing protein [Variovorax paradoxus]|uniref:Helix-turn-helix domain-containing protein n=1 Tax=Variovorax paradoxus TaxID=34073 RepID=A0A5Q0M9B5_VARPD|nr:AraC family transcriptional regulator [Variovorax paradoxus]QFZ86191.1 helix-turn-helix domain-containing protein [Variovorax paradoxus]
MPTKPTPSHSAASSGFEWWRSLEPAGSANTDKLEVPATSLLDMDWCAIRHFSLGTVPHLVDYQMDAHTLMIFDRGSFVEGVRGIEGERFAASGPLDIGIDVVPARARFRGRAEPGSNVGCTTVSIFPDRLDEAMKESLGVNAGLRPSIALQGELLAPLAVRLRQLSRPENLVANNSLYLESMCMVLCRELLLAQQQTHEGRVARPVGGLSPRAQRQVKEFLRENLDQKVELQALAAQAGVSPFHFSRAFKVSFGLPPHKYLLSLRIQQAATLLRGTREPITDVALSVGFSSSGEFARAFRQAMNCTPREFRQANAGTDESGLNTQGNR